MDVGKRKNCCGDCKRQMIFFIYFWSKRFPEGVVKQLECFWGYRLGLCLVHCLPIFSLYELFGLTLLSSQTSRGYLHRQAGGDPARLEVRAEAQEGYLPVGFAPAKWDESFYAICLQQISEEFAKFETFWPVSLCEYFPWAMIRAFSRVPSASSAVWV